MTDPIHPVPPAFPAPSAAAPPPAAYPPPPGAYSVPVGGYSAPQGSYAAPPAPSAPSRITGAVALAVALVAVILPAVVAGFLAFQIGVAVPADALGADADGLAALSPVRTQVLWAEIAFWSGTVLGVLALVLGLVAVVRRRGRGPGVAALVLAVIGPGVFFLIVVLCFGLGGTVGYTGSF